MTKSSSKDLFEIPGPEITNIPSNNPLPKYKKIYSTRFKRHSDLNLEFAVDLFDQLSATEKENFIFSPIVLTQNLAMLHVGAQGSTRKEIEKTMYFDSSDEGDLYSYYGGYPYQFLKGKSLYKNLNFYIGGKKNSEHLTRLKLRARTILIDFFNQNVEFIPFYQPEKALKLINFRGEGFGKASLIGEGEMPLDPRIILTSQARYSNEYIKSEPHRAAEDQTRRPDNFPYADIEDVQAIAIDLSLGKRLLILMPKDFDSFLKKKSKTDFIRKVIENLKPKNVNLDLPNFEQSFQKDYRPILQRMGIKGAFSDKADLSGFSYEQLKVDALFHQSLLSFSSTLTPKDFKNGFDFKIDKPFFFLLSDQEYGTLYMMGAVRNFKEITTPKRPRRKSRP